MRRVGISGLGVIAPTGVGIDSFWSALLEGRSGIREISRFDASIYPCRIGGEVRDLSYESLFDVRKLKTATHASQLALGASELALRDARLGSTQYDPFTTGVMVGTALGGWREGEQQYGMILARGARRVNPFLANGAPHHNPGVEIAAAINARGAHTTFSAGCVSGLQAIGHGAALISAAQLDVCIAGGVESPLVALVFAGMGRTHELSTRNDAPAAASRPFDRDHDGIVLSEGACFVVLEPLERIAARGITPYAEVLGYGSSCDAQGVYSFDESGETAARTLLGLLTRTSTRPEDIDYVCAHANSAATFDRKETIVLKRAFGELAGRIPVSSIKGVLGHSLGASGAFQTTAACLAMRHAMIPPTHNLDAPAPECDLDYVPNTPRAAALKTVVVTNYGYGGINAYLLLAAKRDPD